MPIAKRTLAEKLAKEKEEARERKERSLRALQYQAQSAAAIKLQCAIRRVLAMKVMNEKRRPLTPDEVLAARLKVFLEDRAASRRPGYGVSQGVRPKQVERERMRILAARAERIAKEASDQSETAMKQAQAKRYQLLVSSHEQLALGLQWQKVQAKPSGVELTNAALSVSLSKGQLQFTRSQVVSFQVKGLTWDSFIMDQWGQYYVPLGREDARQKAIEAHIKHTLSPNAKFRGLSRMHPMKKDREKSKSQTQEAASTGTAAEVETSSKEAGSSAGKALRRARRLSGEILGAARRAMGGAGTNEDAAVVATSDDSNANEVRDVAAVPSTDFVVNNDDNELGTLKATRGSIGRVRRMSGEVYEAARRAMGGSGRPVANKVEATGTGEATSDSSSASEAKYESTTDCIVGIGDKKPGAQKATKGSIGRVRRMSGEVYDAAKRVTMDTTDSIRKLLSA